MIQKLAWVFGVVFIVLGVLAFVPAAAPGGMLLGVFSVDAMLAAVYLVSGVVACLAAWRSERAALMYFKVFGIIYAIMTVAGFLQSDSILGLTAVDGADNLLHLVAAALALWAGFGARADR